MPKAELPKTLKGWAAATVAALAGLMAGFVVTNWLNKWFK